MILDILLDAVKDTAKLIPFLLVTYLIMEAIEEKAEAHSVQLLRKAGPAGPLLGALAGIVPQCGFSAAAASLYSGGVITAGTLLAVFLSTSDEMLPIFISEAVPVGTVARVLLCKAVLGAAAGVLVNALLHLAGRHRHSGKHIHDLCEQEHCHCEEGSILKSALIHTAQITAFIFVVTLAAALVIETAGEERVGALLTGSPVLGTFLSGLIGLIPNCAASVMITELYLKNLLSAGQMMAGLLVGSGVGLLVLFRTNRNLRSNLFILAALYAMGCAAGLLINALGIRF